MAWVVGALTSTIVTPAEAAEVVSRSGLLLAAFTWDPRMFETIPGTKSWRHVSDDERAHLLRMVELLRAERQPRRSPGGRPCGACGIAESTAWSRSYRVKWRDGDYADLCAACAQWDDAGPQGSIEHIRDRALRAAVGWTELAPPAVEFRLAVEAMDPAAEGYAESWAYSSGITVIREVIWTARPSVAPAERRAEFEARAAAVEAERDRHRQERREAEVVVPIEW
jgi:hypothetical protein